MARWREPNASVPPSRSTLVLGHRGASAEAPENTLSAFRLAMAQGADGVELDVWRCATGEVVVAHDEDLVRVAGNPLRIADAPLSALRAVDVGAYKGDRFRGERIPLLTEVLEALPTAFVNVELKSGRRAGDLALAHAAAEVIRRAGAGERVIVSSFEWRLVAALRLAAPDVATGLLFEDGYAWRLRTFLGVRSLRPAAVHPDRRPRDRRARAALGRARPRRERLDGGRSGGRGAARARGRHRGHHERAGAGARRSRPGGLELPAELRRAPERRTRASRRRTHSPWGRRRRRTCPRPRGRPSTRSSAARWWSGRSPPRSAGTTPASRSRRPGSSPPAKSLGREVHPLGRGGDVGEAGGQVRGEARHRVHAPALRDEEVDVGRAEVPVLLAEEPRVREADREVGHVLEPLVERPLRLALRREVRRGGEVDEAPAELEAPRQRLADVDGRQVELRRLR